MLEIPVGIGVVLPNCWVCGRTLLDSGGDANCLRHQHHVVPQAAGGQDGPTVSLDSAHHSLLHLVADKMMSGRPWHGLTKSMPHVQLQRLLYLSTRVVQAFKLVEGDPNKRLTLQVSVSRAENEAVKRLADFHGLGKERLIKKLLAAEYNLRFPS